ncbi:outer membrane beta-barrel protein [Dysgonomonas capnocytophagoides]|uniref:outer membrane beta-barrel protein n=1 Tax=Dysgonomonas capnocytophagoides TaxID=45254 RepID=UPI00334201CB
MRKLFLVGALALSTLFVSAQDGLQGKWFVGGTVGYQSLKNQEVTVLGGEFDEVKSFSIMPTIGTFISPSVAVGAAVGYQNIKGTDILSEGKKADTKFNAFVIQPFARKYWNITGGLHFFGEAALPVQFGNTKTGEGDAQVKVNATSFGLALSPGFDYIVNDWISIETKFTVFNIDYTSVKPKGGDSTNNFSIMGDTNANKFGDLTIGVKFLF